MQFKISGTTMQTVSIDLQAGETIYSQRNVMAWMTDSIVMNTTTGGGLFKALKRSLSGGGMFVIDYTAQSQSRIAFAARFPGQIMPFTLQPGEAMVCRKETFLCAEKSVQLEIAFQQRLGAGLFGGEGFILQRVTGPGTVWLDLSGEVVVEDLAPGQKLLVHAGHVGAQTPSIQFSIQMVKGFRNVLFGGEGLFLATVTGPGRVWLQSMPIMNLAEEIGKFLPSSGTEVKDASAGGIAGAVIGNFLKG
jgi:uncharacterized protein (TIGR00266 family)